MLISLHEGEPMWRQVCAFVRSSILEGRLASGSRLPSTRNWAKQLNVSRTVLVTAFEQLMAEGYIEGVPGSGTVVSEGIRTKSFRRADRNQQETAPLQPTLSYFASRLTQAWESQPPGPALENGSHLYDFHYGNRQAVDFPHALWRRLASRRVRHAFPTSAPTAGYLPLREAIALRLKWTRGVNCDPEHVVIVNGSQQALDLLARLLIDPGSDIVLEEPHYHGAREAFRASGARLVPCRVDDEGLCVSELPQGRRSPRLVYVTPSHQFPTGAVLPLARRLALIEWAEQRNAYIVEDDYDGELRYDCHPVEAVQSHDRAGRVIYLGTFSKALSPELRIGYAVVPPALLQSFLAAKWLGDLFSSTLVQEVLADFLQEGHYERHLARLRQRNASRRRALLQATETHLGDRVVVGGVKAGMHAMLWLPTVPVDDLPDLVTRAKQFRVLVYPASNYYLGPASRSGILLSFSSMSEEDICEGIKLLGCAIKSRW